jgi:Carboxypeptidase regulatory-like domain/TonB-dependent Receptor Plug Domain/TonB dependent receptor
MRFKMLLRLQLASVAILTLLLSISAPLLLGQSAGTSALSGTVTDPSGAAIPNVIVTITNNDNGQVRTATTGSDGVYKFNLLQPGTYKVRFSAAGFKTSEVGSVILSVTETPTLDRSLEVGQQSEQVTVEATAETLQTESSTLGTTVGGSTVTALPLSNRNYTQVLGLSAGVNAGVTNATTFGKATQDYSTNGADPGQNNFQMDGVAINNIANGGSSNDAGIYAGIPIPNPDAIQEFKIQTSTYDASYGRNPGANVNVITKSGSNTFHGAIWYFFRNEDLNANDFFENAEGGGKQQILRQNQVGGSIGGPIKKDKLFFYANYQETRQYNGAVAGIGYLPVSLPPIPSGDRSAPGFQAALGAALCPSNHPSNPAAYETFFSAFGVPNVACDGSNINPIALNLLNIKLPNGQYYIPGSGTGSYANTVITDPATYEEHQLILNGDYVVNSKNTLAMRYLYTNNPQVLPLSGGLPGAPGHNLYTNTDAVIKLTTLVTPTLVNELRGSMQRNLAFDTDSTPSTPQALGITPMVPGETEMTPFFILNVDAAGAVIGGGLNPAYSPTNQVQVADQVSWSHGRHTFRAGYEYEKTEYNLTFKGLLRGLEFYGTFADLLIGKGGCVPGNAACSPANPGDTTGSPFGDVLQCLFCTRSGPGGLIHGYRLPNQDAFFQDDWKVSNKLTINMGVRYEYDGIFSDKYGNLTNIWASQLQSLPVPSAPPTNLFNPGAAYLGGNVVPSNYVAHYGPPPAGVLINNRNVPIQNGPPLDNFGPRIGFAWQPLPKFVIRGGFGIFYDRTAEDRFVHSVEQGNPYGETLDFAGPNPESLANPYPAVPPAGVFASRWANLQTGAYSALNTPSLDEDIHTPLVRQFNITFQYELARSWVLEAGYVGASGINLIDTYHDANAPLLASPSNPINGQTDNTTGNVQLRVPYLGYQPAGYQVTSFDGTYNYNSLQVTLRKQFSHGFTMQASYTWSKNLTTLSSTNFNNISADSNDPSNLAQQYGPSYFSHPNRFIINYSYDLPFGQHKGALGLVANGWNVSGVTTVQDGVPLTISDSAAGSAFGLGTFGEARAQMCPGSTYGSIATPGGIDQRLGGGLGGPGYLNINAFCSPLVAPNSPDGATLFGNAGQGIILGPGQFNFDISLLKNFKITERQSMQFRAEFFNAFNHPQFEPPGNISPTPPAALNVNAPGSFGQITELSVNPRIVQFALKYIF